MGAKRKYYNLQQIRDYGVLNVILNDKGTAKEIVMNRNGFTYSKKPTLYDTFHKYSGNRQGYQYCTIYDNVEKKYIQIPIHDIIWLLSGRELPEGYEIDHIDNNQFNNKLENLQLLTHKENLLKRGIGRNQYNCQLTDEEILEYRKNLQSLIDRKRELHEVYKQKRDNKSRIEWKNAVDKYNNFKKLQLPEVKKRGN